MANIFIEGDDSPKRYETNKVSINDLRLDPENVRFRHLEKIMNQQEIQDYIWNEPDTKILFKQIISSGGLSELPFVTKDMVVKEGNRRLVCLKKADSMVKEGAFNGTFPENVFEQVEVNMFNSDLTSEQMDILLARWHVTGKKEWDALNQASHIYKMYDGGRSYESIRDYLGMSKGQVIQKCKAYNYTIQYMNFTGDDDIKKYSFFEEMYKKKFVREWVEQSPTNLNSYFRWVKEGKFNFTGAKDARFLPEILQDPKALNILDSEDGNIEKARFQIQKNNPAYSSGTFKALENAIDALKNIPKSELEEIPHSEAKKDMLYKLRDEVNETIRFLKLK